MNIDTKELEAFIKKAGLATYAGGGKEEEKPERGGFTELTFSEGKYFYRDSYTGFTRSRGMELVRFDNRPIWSSLYGGGMKEGKEDLASETFAFLKKAMQQKPTDLLSFRGPLFPHIFSQGDWVYMYKQRGGVEEFSGREHIFYKNELVFFHKIMGGIIK